jgi:CubicO group peptidase (beta-lactamase class C family)
MLSPAYRQITVRMLLDHSSGFPGSEYRNIFTTELVPGYAQQTMEALASERLKTTPGYMSVYCNDGFTMIEMLVPAVTGKTFAQFVQDEVFTPLGMTHSAYPLEPFADGAYAKCYSGDTAHP